MFIDLRSRNEVYKTGLGSIMTQPNISAREDQHILRYVSAIDVGRTGKTTLVYDSMPLKMVRPTKNAVPQCRSQTQLHLIPVTSTVKRWIESYSYSL